MPGSFSSQGAVVDAILAMIAGLPAVNGPSPPVTVFDGPLGGAGIPPQFIAIAGQGETDAMPSVEEWSWIGSLGRYENYGVKGSVYCFVGGDDNLGQFSLSNAQKAARDQATALLQAIEKGFLDDPALTNQNSGQPMVVWAYLTRSELKQTGAEDPDVAKGRWAQYDFTISVKNTLNYVPTP